MANLISEVCGKGQCADELAERVTRPAGATEQLAVYLGAALDVDNVRIEIAQNAT